jgi:hypothetical protein
MKKLISFILALVFVMGMGYELQAAAAGGRGAKGFKVIRFSASAVEVCASAAVLYSVVTSTAATTDFVVFRDSDTANTSSTIAFQLSPSATIAGQTTFDPPLQFVNGISVNQPATNNQTLFTYECGYATGGY